MSYFNTVTYDSTSTGYNSEYPIYIDGTSASIPVNGAKYFGNVFGNVMCSLINDGGETILGGNLMVTKNFNLGGGLCILPTYSILSNNVITNVQGTSTYISGNALTFVAGVTSNIQAQINNVSANVTGNATYFSGLTSGLQSQITSLKNSTTSVSSTTSTTIISSNVSIYGQIDDLNLAVNGYSAIAESSSIAGDLVVGNNIVNSGSIITGKKIQCSSLIVDNAIIQSDTQVQLQIIFDILMRNNLY